MKLSAELLKIDPESTKSKIVDFIRRETKRAMAKGVVVGMSGGIDSSLTAALCSYALGGKNVLGITLPDELTNPKDVEDAKEIAKRFGIKHLVIDISEIVKSIYRSLPLFDPDHLISRGNIKPRIRMTILYYYANLLGRLVVGTGNRSEIMVGYFTKYGDGGADIVPLAGLYKTQVRQLARYLRFPERIINKKPSSGLWPGQTDEDELGVKYEDLDIILYGLEKGMSAEEISKELNVNLSLVEKIITRIKNSEHKRRGPLLFKDIK